MGKTTLVEKDILDGKRLLEALDHADFRARAALWFYMFEPGEYQ